MEGDPLTTVWIVSITEIITAFKAAIKSFIILQLLTVIVNAGYGIVRTIYRNKTSQTKKRYSY